MKVLYWITLVLTVVGAVNWGLVAWLDFDVVAYFFSPKEIVAEVIYSLVALSGLYLLVSSLFWCKSGSCCNHEE